MCHFLHTKKVLCHLPQNFCCVLPIPVFCSIHVQRPLTEIKSRLDECAGVTFNSVLCNLYQDGQDSIGWHSDNEPELGTNPVVGSVSFGALRVFHFRHKKEKSLRMKVELPHGSFLLMRGPTQHNWNHQLPKTTKQVNPRINLTYRMIHT